MAAMIPILLSGGSGTRLWPASRAMLPKQFCNLFGEPLQTLSLRRVSALGDPWIVTSAGLKILTEKNLKENGMKARTLFEPRARNTAAAIAYLCRSLQMENRGQEIVAIFPADHLIRNETAFREAVQIAVGEAEKNKVVTLGIRPDMPETGFGYIQFAGQPGATLKALAVEKFHEKPSKEKAEEFLRSGCFAWNAGIFIFKVDVMTELLAKYEPLAWTPFLSLKSDLSNLPEIYETVKATSIDYAVMEKIGGTGTLVCLPVEMGWNDVGSWDAVAEESLHQGQPYSKGVKVSARNIQNVFVKAPPGKTVALLGVEDLSIVDTGDALLIAKKGEAQNVKLLVDDWMKAGDLVATEHTSEDRPWGRFEVMRDTDHFKSKVITVDAGQQLSYQSHAKREEHWIITGGQGEVVLNDKIISVKTGSYIHIPTGAKHRMRNTGRETLEFVEVQVGTYFGEDDIVRYQDDYHRV